MTRERFEPLLIEHITQLSLMAQQQTSHCEDAKDLLQDTILLMLERVETYEDLNFRGYSYTLLHNLYRNSTRKNHIINSVEDLSLYDYRSEEHQDCYNEIIRSIERLPQRNATAIRMYIDGYQYDEIATQLHISIGTVKSRISRARTQLQSQLKEYR